MKISRFSEGAPAPSILQGGGGMWILQARVALSGEMEKGRAMLGLDGRFTYVINA